MPLIRISILVLVSLLSAQGQSSINLSEAVPIEGINQWITIRGVDQSHPILLFLHGGPGNSVMGYSDRFTAELQQHFVVVQWDQRASGVTATLNSSDEALSVAQMEKDAVALIEYLRERFSKDKVYLMGHSWGAFLGLMVAADYPALLQGYIAISPMIFQEQSDSLSLQWMIAKARAQENKRALHELETVHIPLATADDLYYHRSWLARLMGKKFPTRQYVDDWAAKWLPLYKEASAVNFFKVAPEINCPIYFFVGKLDYQTHCELTFAYYNMLKAKDKYWYWFEEAGHSIPAQFPKKLQDIVILEILPKAPN